MQRKSIKEKNNFIEYLKHDNIFIKKLLEEIFKEKINYIEYVGLEKLEKIPEYEFELVCLKVNLIDNRHYDIFIKLIDPNKITETIFCYWYFCDEKYRIDKFNKNMVHYKNKKANIIEYKKHDCEKKLNIQLLNSRNKIWKKSDVHFIEIKKYLSNIKKDESLCENFAVKNDILFIGIVKN